MRKSFFSICEESKRLNINNKNAVYYQNMSLSLSNISNFLLYGPPGSGKYTESLKIIRQFSPSQLKYEKRLLISSLKNEHIIKISDIHYEINMENLTCNSKIVFNDVYNYILDSIAIHPYKCGIIVCKNFHTIDKELLEIFYSYMQKIINSTITVKFIILTDNISFIPANILQTCKILYYQKLSATNYLKLASKDNRKFLREATATATATTMQSKDFLNNCDNINILKNFKLTANNLTHIDYKKKTCDIIVNIILQKKIDYVEIRNRLYDILILNLDIYECVYYILREIIMRNKDKDKDKDLNLTTTFPKVCEFFKYYNNNYRPIYHLESLVYFLIEEIS